MLCWFLLSKEREFRVDWQICFLAEITIFFVYICFPDRQNEEGCMSVSDYLGMETWSHSFPSRSNERLILLPIKISHHLLEESLASCASYHASAHPGPDPKRFLLFHPGSRQRRISTRAVEQILCVCRIRREQIERPIRIVSRHPVQHPPLIVPLLENIVVSPRAHYPCRIGFPVDPPFPVHGRSLLAVRPVCISVYLPYSDGVAPLIERKDGVVVVESAADLDVPVRCAVSIGVDTWEGRIWPVEACVEVGVVAGTVIIDVDLMEVELFHDGEFVRDCESTRNGLWDC